MSMCVSMHAEDFQAVHSKGSHHMQHFVLCTGSRLAQHGRSKLQGLSNNDIWADCLLSWHAAGSNAQGVESYEYVPGAGDDEESWARGLTPALLWAHHKVLPTRQAPSSCKSKLSSVCRTTQRAVRSSSERNIGFACTCRKHRIDALTGSGHVQASVR